MPRRWPVKEGYVIRSTRTMNLGMAMLMLVLGTVESGRARAATHQDPRALAIVEALEKAIAPENGWSKVGGIRFTYAVRKDGVTLTEYHHSWNVVSGQYRVDWQPQGGDARVALLNIGAKGRQGQAYVRLIATGGGPTIESTTDGTPATGQSLSSRPDWVRAPAPMERQILATSYQRFINDTYWLLMPLKLRDPGVNLDYDGEKTIGKQTYDLIRLGFEGVGLTPGDHYWVYVNRDSHLIDRVDFLPEPGTRPDWVQATQDEGSAKKADDAAGGGQAPLEGGQRTSWTWRNWQSFGPLKLATEKSMEGGSISIVLKNIEVLSSMPDSEFVAPLRPVSNAGQQPQAKPKEKSNKG